MASAKLYHPLYQNWTEYARGAPDIVGYWAETQIFGGVVAFDRGSSGRKVCSTVSLLSIVESTRLNRSVADLRLSFLCGFRIMQCTYIHLLESSSGFPNFSLSDFQRLVKSNNVACQMESSFCFRSLLNQVHKL